MQGSCCIFLRMVNGVMSGKIHPRNGRKTGLLRYWSSKLYIIIGNISDNQKRLTWKDIFKQNIVVITTIKDGMLNGLVKIFGKISSDPSYSCNDQKLIEHSLGLIGMFENGSAVGYFWKGLL